MSGKAVILSAPSGAGKTTIVKHILSQNLGLEFSISACTRAPRNNEVNGKDYYFISPAEFKEHIGEGAFVEWEEVYEDQYYGTLKTEVNRIWDKGNHVIFDVDVKGGLNLKKYFGNRALSVFVKPPSIEILKKRLLKRDTETPETIDRRLGKAAQEMSFADQFDYVLVNDELEKTKKEAVEVIRNFLES